MPKPDGFVRAYYRGIPAYYNLDTDEIIGRNWIYDKLILVNIWVDVELFGIEEFPIYIEDDNQKLE